ncbi:GTPase domain-containing protein [Methanocaldococcus fervens]|uniref:Small GTP-binding protein n=1 Tax=Methanocaldococcus fervens (strain DSM 4213 / JCM 15782 / AG86) TaxID=573064 RepID=C7P628_METFA|nr:GTP-binding protein [Methanocaldococcus fervens]ACV24010.1 small GTP-binding protein [Methanocaldococcus fervens AG86]
MKKEIKVVVIGSSDVGKTTLMENLIGKIGKVEHNGITTAIDYGSLKIDDKKIHFFGTPGQKRFEFMRELALRGTDFALLVLDASKGVTEEDKEIIKMLESKKIPYGVFINKVDVGEIDAEKIYNLCSPEFIAKGCAIKKEGFDELINKIISHV